MDKKWWTLIAVGAGTFMLLLGTSGVLADRYGRKRLFQIGLVTFTLGSLLCGVAQDPLMLILSRSGQGIGGGITTNWSWRGIFLVKGPLGVLALPGPPGGGGGGGAPAP